MIQHGVIPKQANFMTLNPQIKTSATDKITVPNDTRPWTPSMRIALVNNYGAAGSNATIVVREHAADLMSRQASNGVVSWSSSASYPILLSAKSTESLQMYTAALKSYVPNDRESLKNMAYSIARRQNPSLEHRTSFTISEPADLLSGLEKAVAKKCNGRYPVVLCFGGQTGRSISLSRELYDASKLFRHHLVSLA
jgi:acyl transferase domain-containing protein